MSSPTRTVAGLMLFGLAGACNSPTEPGRNPQPSANALEITTITTVAPLETASAQAFLRASNGTREDVTARVSWTTSDSGVLSVSSGGRVTGGAIGEATLQASLLGLSASATVIVVPAGTFRLVGTLKPSGATIPLAGVQVELITASGKVLKTKADGRAVFRFYGVAGHARLKVSRPVFHTYEADLDIQGHSTHDVSLSSINLGGTYKLTVSASSRCRSELPEDLRVRTYTALIDQLNGSLTVTLQYPSPLSWGQPYKFTGGFGATNEVIFELGAEEWWLEGGAEFHAHGIAISRFSAGGLSGFLDGELKAIVSNPGGRGNRTIVCTASDHGVVFSR